MELERIKEGWVGMAEGASWSPSHSPALYLLSGLWQGPPRLLLTSLAGSHKGFLQSLPS